MSRSLNAMLSPTVSIICREKAPSSWVQKNITEGGLSTLQDFRSKNSGLYKIFDQNFLTLQSSEIFFLTNFRNKTSFFELFTCSFRAKLRGKDRKYHSEQICTKYQSFVVEIISCNFSSG